MGKSTVNYTPERNGTEQRYKIITRAKVTDRSMKKYISEVVADQWFIYIFKGCLAEGLGAEHRGRR